MWYITKPYTKNQKFESSKHLKSVSINYGEKVVIEGAVDGLLCIYKGHIMRISTLNVYLDAATYKKKFNAVLTEIKAPQVLLEEII